MRSKFAVAVFTLAIALMAGTPRRLEIEGISMLHFVSPAVFKVEIFVLDGLRRGASS